MKKIRSIAVRTAALILAAVMCFTDAALAASSFTDVPQDEWYHSWVTKAADRKLVSGVGGGRYSPMGTVTYAEFATMLTKAVYPEDVARQAGTTPWWLSYCEIAEKHGLFSKTALTSSAVWASVAETGIPRQDMAVMLFNAMKDLGLTLPDAGAVAAAQGSIQDYAGIAAAKAEAVKTCYTMQLINGYGDGRFGPNDTMNRAEAAVVLCKIYDLVRQNREKTPPYPPSWVDEDEYAVYTSAHYPGRYETLFQPENWEVVLQLRADAEAGNPYPGSRTDNPFYSDWITFYNELATYSSNNLFELLLLSLKYYDMTGDFDALNRAQLVYGSRLMRFVTNASTRTERIYLLWNARACALYSTWKPLSNDMLRNLDTLLLQTSYTMEDVYDHPFMKGITQEQKDSIAAQLREYTSQGTAVCLDNVIVLARKWPKAETVDGQVMIPLSFFEEYLGADVRQDGDTITLTRVGRTAVLHLGSKTALVDGVSVAMGAAPYLQTKQNSVMLPAVSVSGFLGQKAWWDKTLNAVFVEEDKTAAGSSNLERWALPMGAMLAFMNDGYTLDLPVGDYEFGTVRRGAPRRDSETKKNTTMALLCRDHLSSGWGIDSREELISTVLRMTVAGHNISFLRDAAVVNQLTPTEYRKLLSNATGMDTYMWPYTKQLFEQWGERGILCWDLFRMSNLVQWGWCAGYITYAEALVLLEPAVSLLKENFSSWEEAYENYLGGYCWWARENVLDKSIWEIRRADYYSTMKEQDNTLNHGAFFDDTLFQTDIIPVPDLTIDDILKTLE